VDDTSAGARTVARISVPSSYASFLMLQLLAKEDVGDPMVRDVALSIRANAGHRADEFGAAVQRWVQQNIAYVRETHEMFQDAAYSLSVRAGDCDDHGRLVYALCEAAGYTARIMPLFKAEREVAHAVAQIKVGDKWCWVETTIAANFDEHPIAAARRLGLGARSDIVDSADVVGA
jgi:transglutaminase-like putative cysteine protease